MFLLVGLCSPINKEWEITTRIKEYSFSIFYLLKKSLIRLKLPYKKEAKDRKISE